MEKINSNNISDLQKNQVVISGCEVIWKKSEIEFGGSENIVYFAGGSAGSKIVLENTRIKCIGNHNIIFINETKYPLKVSISVGHGCSVYLGKNFYSAATTRFIANETSNIYVGDMCLFARDIWIRTSDMHLIYDIQSGHRINPNKDVLICEHVWLGQNVTCLKGTIIGSGSIVGLGSLCNGDKTQRVNCIYTGQPAHLTKEGIFWLHKGSNSISEEEVRSGKFDYSKETGGIFPEDYDKWLLDEYQKRFVSYNMMERIDFFTNISQNGKLL